MFNKCIQSSHIFKAVVLYCTLLTTSLEVKRVHNIQDKVGKCSMGGGGGVFNIYKCLF